MRAETCRSSYAAGTGTRCAWLAAMLLYVPPQVGGQLAEPSWPTLGHDARHSGQSRHNGPDMPHLLWRVLAGDHLTAYMSAHDTAPVIGPAVGTDGSICIGTVGGTSAFWPDGTLRWNHRDGEGAFSSPASGSDGTIYAGIGLGVFAFRSDGTPEWEFETGGRVVSSPITGPDGTVYVGSQDGRLYALTPGGGLKWTYDTGDPVHSPPAMTADGLILVRSAHAVHALTPDGVLQWRYPVSWAPSSPAVSEDGTIYVGSGDGLCALTPDGTLRWQYLLETSPWGSPAVAADGTIYAAGLYYLDAHGPWSELVALWPDGAEKWRYERQIHRTFSSPAIGADGAIYVYVTVLVPATPAFPASGVYALRPDGSVKWRCELDAGWSLPAPTGGDRAERDPLSCCWERRSDRPGFCDHLSGVPGAGPCPAGATSPPECPESIQW